MGVGTICDGCDIITDPIELLFGIEKLADMEALFIIGGAGGTVGGLIGGDLLSPVSRRLFAIIFASVSSGRSRFKLGLTGIEGSKEGV
jgi:hypothetical protein